MKAVKRTSTAERKLRVEMQPTFVNQGRHAAKLRDNRLPETHGSYRAVKRAEKAWKRSLSKAQRAQLRGADAA